MADKAARRTKFEEAWVTIRDELIAYIKVNKMPQDAVEWFYRNLEYNVPGGKLNRGMSVVDTLEIIKGRPLNEEEYLQAAVLGWGVELLQAFFLVSDDLMDSSITRRGQPCWYRVPKVGFISINDAFMLEASIYYLLKLHFRTQPYYVDLLDLFHETTFQTELGQLIDLITAPEDEVDLSRFSLEKHSLIVIYKTAYYSFYLPVALAMLVAGIKGTPTSSPSSLEEARKGLVHPLSDSLPKDDPYVIAKRILIPLGEYFQIQDDFLDFSGVPSQIGKVGTDIVDNKCSWVVNTALAIANPQQLEVLKKNYGVKPTEEEKKKADEITAKAPKNEKGLPEEQGYLGEAEKRVKALFEELGIRERYAAYEAGVYEKLNKMIEEVQEPKPGQEGLRREVFTSFLGKIYKRQK